MSRLLLQLLLVAVLNAMGQLSFKLGSGAFASFGRVISTPSVLLDHPYFLVGGLLYGTSLMLYVNVLSQVPLSRAYPIMGLTYVIVVLASGIVLEETLNARVMGGAALIFVGVSMIGLGLEG